MNDPALRLTDKGREAVEFMQRADAWYARNRPAVDRWLASNPPDGPWGGQPHYYAYVEMPNPETVVGRLMLMVGM